MNELTSRLVRHTNESVETENARISQIGYQCSMAVRKLVSSQNSKLQQIKLRLGYVVQEAIARMQHHLNILEKRNQYLSPLEILKRGYSITSQNGKIVKDGELLHEGDLLETLFYKGKRKSRVID